MDIRIFMDIRSFENRPLRSYRPDHSGFFPGHAPFSRFLGCFLRKMRFFSKKSSKKFGGNEKVRIFAARFGKNDEFSRLKRKVH